MKALWLELGDSAITAIPIHFMAWSDKFATGRLEKYPLMARWSACVVVAWPDCLTLASY